MATVALAPCEDRTLLTFSNDNELKQNNFGGEDCALMTEVFTDWEYNGSNDYHWGTEGPAGYVFVTFATDGHEMTTLKYDGGGYVSETYAKLVILN